MIFIILIPLVLIGNLFFGITGLIKQSVTIYGKRRVTNGAARTIGIVLIIGGFLGVFTYSLGGLLALLISLGIGFAARPTTADEIPEWQDEGRHVKIGDFILDDAPEYAIGTGQEGYSLQDENTDHGQTRRLTPDVLESASGPSERISVTHQRPVGSGLDMPPSLASSAVPRPDMSPVRRSLPDTWMGDGVGRVEPAPAPTVRDNLTPTRPGQSTPGSNLPTPPHGTPPVRPRPIADLPTPPHGLPPVWPTPAADLPTPPHGMPPVRPAPAGDLPTPPHGTPPINIGGQRSVQAQPVSPSGSKSPAFLQLIQGDLPVRQIWIDNDNFLIGRGRSVDLQLLNPKVSREHARIRYGDSKWFIQDQKGTNGVKVNQNRVKAIQLHPGDQIEIMDYIFVFQVEQG